jgi:F0F1-type ATP synthase assembly protein I
MANQTDPKKEELNVSTFAGAGLQFALGIVLFLFLGRWADQKLGTAPLLLLLGVFVGGGGGFYSMYRRISQAQKADDERRAREKASGKSQ